MTRRTRAMMTSIGWDGLARKARSSPGPDRSGHVLAQPDGGTGGLASPRPSTSWYWPTTVHDDRDRHDTPSNPASGPGQTVIGISARAAFHDPPDQVSSIPSRPEPPRVMPARGPAGQRCGSRSPSRPGPGHGPHRSAGIGWG